jgi:hypothetical protein
LAILDLGTGWKRVVTFTPLSLYSLEGTPVPIGLEVRWASVSLEDAEKRKISFLCLESNPKSSSGPARSPSLCSLNYSKISVNMKMLEEVA